MRGRRFAGVLASAVLFGAAAPAFSQAEREYPRGRLVQPTHAELVQAANEMYAKAFGEARPTRAWLVRLGSGETIERFASRFGGEHSFTKPGQDAEIGFQVPTAVREVAVRGDQWVDKGDLLIRGDDAEDLAMVEIQRVRAEVDLPVKRADEQLANARTELEEMRNAFNQGAATSQQLNRAQVAVNIAELDVLLAKENQKQELLQLNRAKARADRLRLVAPFSGYVASIMVDVGDVIRETTPVIRVVQLDPLRIDVHTPVTLIEELSISRGDSAWVLIGRPGQPMVIEGKVSEVSRAADFASRKQRVRIDVPNPEHMQSGLAAWVRFSPPSEELLQQMNETVPAPVREEGAEVAGRD